MCASRETRQFVFSLLAYPSDFGSLCIDLGLVVSCYCSVVVNTTLQYLCAWVRFTCIAFLVRSLYSRLLYMHGFKRLFPLLCPMASNWSLPSHATILTCLRGLSNRRARSMSYCRRLGPQHIRARRKGSPRIAGDAPGGGTRKIIEAERMEEKRKRKLDKIAHIVSTVHSISPHYFA